MSCGLAAAAVISGFFLLSPGRTASFPGQIPWSANSLLRPLTELIALGRVFQTERGVEIKDIAWNVAATLSLGLLGASFLLRRHEVHLRRHIRQPWFQAQLFFLGWAAMSAASAAWSTAPGLSLGQAGLYAMAVGWAVSIGWTLRQPQFLLLCRILMLAGAAAAGLCIWYYYERNPMHRPGFPIGNPATLAGCLLPALLFTIAEIQARLSRGPAPQTLASDRVAGGTRIWTVASAALFLVVAYALWLAFSRSTLIGLAIALTVVAFFAIRRAWRWGLIACLVVGIAVAGFWLATFSSQDVSMARGATIRYRLYTWRYAAELMNKHATLGLGAGCFPRFAGERAAFDRAIDPGAFLGEIVSHAHNELLEVCAEVGLVGAVIWVAGLVATFFAALRVVRLRAGSRDGPYAVALLAAYLGLLGDSMFSAGLRLPALPIVFYTVIALIWSQARASAATTFTDVTDLIHAADRPRTVRTVLIGLCAWIAAGGAGVLTWQNFNGVVADTASAAALRRGDYRAAAGDAEQAFNDLLDPGRRLLALDRVVVARLELARASLQAEALSASAPAATTGSQSGANAAAAVQSALAAAERLMRGTRGWHRSGAYYAQAAELEAQRLQMAGNPSAVQWLSRAQAAWRRQRQWLPYDFDTLMRLTQYPTDGQSMVGLLRDALRSDEFDPRRWRGRLAELKDSREFAVAIERQLSAIAPLTAESDTDSLVRSMAPEAYRLAAAWQMLRGKSDEAVRLANEALGLYAPMRSRFPTMSAHTLAEMAEYEFRGDPRRAAEAAGRMEEAIRSLPDIQAQQREAIARPYREAGALYALAAGDVRRARAMIDGAADDVPTDTELAQRLAEFTGDLLRTDSVPLDVAAGWLDTVLTLDRSNFTGWSWVAWCVAKRGDAIVLEQVFAQARASGVTAEQIERMRRSLAAVFPTRPTTTTAPASLRDSR